MSRPFSERVAGDDWREAAHAWVHERLAALGWTVTGPIEQPRIRPWSTQLTVPTDAGTVWFKATCRSMAFEPVLQEVLADLVPDAVDPPLAVDAEHGWMLTADRGTTLGERDEPTVADWGTVLDEAARLQQRVVAHRDRVLATGLPDCSPATVVGRFDRLVAVLTELPDEHPSHVSSELAERLLARRPRIVDAAARLDASVLPTTWQHGDLHPWNVFAVADDQLRVFDFGDAQWAHAVEVLTVPQGWILERTSLSWDALLQRYAAAWDLTAADLAADVAAAAATQPVNRALTWWRCLAEASAEEWRAWGEAPRHHLSGVLDAP